MTKRKRDYFRTGTILKAKVTKTHTFRSGGHYPPRKSVRNVARPSRAWYTLNNHISETVPFLASSCRAVATKLG